MIGEIVPGGACNARDPDRRMVSNANARDTFRCAGFPTPFDDTQYDRVDAQATALYAMAGLQFDLGPMPVTVNGGVRYVDTAVISSGCHPVQNADGSTGYTDAPVSTDGHYSDALPGFNVSAELRDGSLLRAAASETLTSTGITGIACKRTAGWNVSIGLRIADNLTLGRKGIDMTAEATTGYTMDRSFPTMYELSGRRIPLALRADFRYVAVSARMKRPPHAVAFSCWVSALPNRAEAVVGPCCARAGSQLRANT